MAGTGTPVEVRKNPHSTTWYNATILDVVGKNIKVGFEDDVWPTKLVPSYSVRRCPQDDDWLDFDPQVDDAVEVLVTASKGNPSGWALGRVKAIRNSFFFIGFMGSHKAAQDLIVERESLRPVNGEPSIDTTGMVRRLLPAKPELHHWIHSKDFRGCLTSVRLKCRLLLATWVEAEPGAEPEVEILLIGYDRGVELAVKLFVMIHFKNQVEMARFDAQCEKFDRRLSELKRIHGSMHRETFPLEPRLTRQLLGRAREVRARLGVEAKLQERVPNPNGGPPVTMVTLIGPTQQAVMEAKDELEFITDRIPVKDEEQVRWILGKNFQNIKSIARDTHLQYMKFDDLTNSLELCGLREQIKNAKNLIYEHCSYLPVYQSIGEERQAIRQREEDLEEMRRSRYPGDRRGGPGKGAGAGRQRAEGEPF